MADDTILVEMANKAAKEPKAKPIDQNRKKPEVKAGPALAPPMPESIPDELPRNINFNTDNEKSRTAFGFTLAKLLVIFSLIAAEAAKQPAIFMKDEEALGMAIPASIILMRIGWFQSLMSQYGQYAVSMDEYILLFWAMYTYYLRVRKEMDHEPKRRGDAIGPKQADAGRYDTGSGNGLSALAQIPAFGREA